MDIPQMMRQRPKNLNTTPSKYNCDICKDVGVITRRDENGIVYSKNCVCVIRQINQRRITNSGLANTFEKYDFKNFEKTEPWQNVIFTKARNFLTRPEKFIFFGGQSGAGKTHLCTAICKELIKEKSVIYKTWSEIANIKFITDIDKKHEEISTLQKTDVLYIDDFFKVKDTDKSKISNADLVIAFDILNHRLQNELTTIISSEFDIKEIIEIDEAVGGRILEGTGADNCIYISRNADRNFRTKKLLVV